MAKFPFGFNRMQPIGQLKKRHSVTSAIVPSVVADTTMPNLSVPVYFFRNISNFIAHPSLSISALSLFVLMYPPNKRWRYGDPGYAFRTHSTQNMDDMTRSGDRPYNWKPMTTECNGLHSNIERREECGCPINEVATSMSVCVLVHCKSG